MARYTEAVCKLCRREKMKLYLKGERCFSDKCSVEKRGYPPGEHGRRRSRRKEYGIQLREKQKVKRIYGVLENQFRRYFEEAESKKGVTGDTLLQILERRFDSVASSLGFGSSKSHARQLIKHGHMEINNSKVDIPSYQVNIGDVITPRERIQENEELKRAVEAANGRGVPDWLELNVDKMEGRVLRLPKRDDIKLPIDEQLIVEHYSR